MSLPPPTTVIALAKVVRTARIQAGLAPSQIVTACRAIIRSRRTTAVGDVAPDGSGTAKSATSRSAFPRYSAFCWTGRRAIRPPGRHEGIDMAPGYNDGTVYVSTVPGSGPRQAHSAESWRS